MITWLYGHCSNQTKSRILSFSEFAHGIWWTTVSTARDPPNIFNTFRDSLIHDHCWISLCLNGGSASDIWLQKQYIFQAKLQQRKFSPQNPLRILQRLLPLTCSQARLIANLKKTNVLPCIKILSKRD